MDAPSSLPPSSSSLPISSDLVEPTSLRTLTSSHPQDPINHLLPPLPNELKKEILRFCDPSTLATTSLVSMAFLEMSSPFLYHDVTIRGWEKMVKLFCVRKLQQPQIDVYLSLEQIQHLTYIHLPSQQEQPSLSKSSPLPVSSLTIEFLNHDVGSPPSSLLALFNPLTLSIRAPLPKSPEQLPSVSLTPLAYWTRLQTLILRNAQLADVRATQWFSSLERPLSIEIDGSETFVGGDSVEGRMLSRQLEDITLAALGWTTSMPTWFGGVKVLFGSKEEVKEFKEKVDALKESGAWAGVHGVVEEVFEKVELLSLSSSTPPRRRGQQDDDASNTESSLVWIRSRSRR